MVVSTQCPICEKDNKVQLQAILLCCKKKVCVDCVIKVLTKTKPRICPFCNDDPMQKIPKRALCEIVVQSLGQIITRFPFVGNPTVAFIQEEITKRTGRSFEANTRFKYVLVYKDRILCCESYLSDYDYRFDGAMEIQLMQLREPTKVEEILVSPTMNVLEPMEIEEIAVGPM